MKIVKATEVGVTATGEHVQITLKAGDKKHIEVCVYVEVECSIYIRKDGDIVVE